MKLFDGFYTKIKQIDVKKLNTHYEILDDNEFLADYKVSDAGFTFIEISVKQKKITIKNHDNGYEHRVILIIYGGYR